jgi:hypothetical protein
MLCYLSAMADLIYCGNEKVGAAETRAMLVGPFAAVWSPPMWRKAAVADGDRLWLLWQAAGVPAVRLLGGGRVMGAPDGRVDWTNRTAPGIVDAARALGYGGPTNMAFLRLRDVGVPEDMPEIWGLGEVPVGLSVASARQVAVLARVVAV